MTVSKHIVSLPSSVENSNQTRLLPKPHKYFNSYKLVHQIEGRWRIKIDKLAYDEEYALNLTRLLEDSDLISKVRLNRQASSLIIEYDAQKVSHSQLNNYLLVRMEEADLGYVASPNSQPETNSVEEINYLQRLGIPTASLIIALLAAPLELPSFLVGAVILGACTPAFKRAWTSITEDKTLNVDFLDSVAIILSVAQGHFIPPTLMITLIEAGEVIRDTTARSSHRQTYNLLDSLGQYAWVEKDGAQLQVPLKNLQEGDLVAVYPGDLIPADGKIVRGSALIDQHKLTGESVPVHLNIEDEVYASTLVVEGQLLIKVERLGTKTRAGMVVELMKAAPIHDTRIENYATKFANIAVIPTLLLAGGVFALTGDLTRASTIATLDFGTGIRISVPTTVLAGLTQAAKTGVYIRSGRAIEMLSKIDCVVFDKTGTLTQGKAAVVDVKVTSQGVSETEILSLAASAEQGLSHPVAHAIVQGAKDRGIATRECQTWDYRVGLGVEATIEGRKVLVGSSRLMETEKIDISASNSFKTGSISLAYVARDGVLIGVILYADPVREESPGVIAELHKQGIETHMLTGDVQRVADAVAQTLGIDRVHAQAFPERKVEVVKRLKEEGKTVAFIGDGINDSAALAYADVSISFAAGSDIARETADIVLMDDHLSGLPHAITISKEVMDIIYQNAVIVGGPNFAALFFGAFFALDPMLAILINNGSAILAGLNGLRVTLGEDKKTYT